MREALKGLSPAGPDVASWLWWTSPRRESKPFPASNGATGVAPAQAREDLARLEQELERAQIRVREAEARADDAERRLGEGRPSDAPAPATVSLNAASFEDLRGLGLSVNQAARLIAQRDQRGGFDSLGELAGLYGLPRELVVMLQQRAGV